MTEFKVGDRVVFKYCGNGSGPDFPVREAKTTIKEIYPSGILRLEGDTLNDLYYVHSNSVRLLKKKPRRRVWVHKLWLEDNDSKGYVEFSTTPPGPFAVDNYVEFVEVKGKKK